jgi:ribosomal protein S27E
MKAKPPEAIEIDRLYGLEPVYEAGNDPRMVALSAFAKIRCPYCLQRSEIAVETVYGSQQYVQDCQICCRAIELIVEVSGGELTRLTAQRADGESLR